MTLAYPWLLIAPILIYLPQLFRQSQKFRHLVFPDKKRLIPPFDQSWRVILRKPLLHFLTLSAICLFSFAAARPQRVTPLPLPDTARNLMLALDVSGSMKTRDFEIAGRVASRLDAVKLVVSQFVSRRAGDRIGLVIFGTDAYLECPLTLDHQLLTRLIANLSVGVAGEGTAIGDGIALGLKRISSLQDFTKDLENSQKTSALILLTDGVNTSGAIDPLQAAEVAKDLGIKIHTIGIGSNDTLQLAKRNPFFGANLKRYEFDEAMLRKISDGSGGYYFNASDLADLEKVYLEIDKLEQKEIAALDRVQIDELFTPFLLAGLICYLLYFLLARTVFLVVP